MVAQEVDLATLMARGRSLGEHLAAGAVVWLTGELGAGKTTLVKAIAKGLGVAEAATSPTYSLVHRYHGRRGPIFHVDCYRLKTVDEGRDLDWEGLAAEGDVVLIEWPERAGIWALPPTQRIRLAHLDDPDCRRLEVG